MEIMHTVLGVKDSSYAFFQLPFQAYHWSTTEVLFVDIDHTGWHHFPYLFNVVCLNSITTSYMACGRALFNKQDGISIGKALNVLVQNVKEQNDYKILTARAQGNTP